MRLVLRYFVAFIIIEMMMVYHCFGNSNKLYPEIQTSSTQEELYQTNHTHSATEFFEILELNESNETNEEENGKSLNPAGLLNFYTSVFYKKALQGNFKNSYEDFKISNPSLIILYHSWKFHL